MGKFYASKTAEIEEREIIHEAIAREAACECMVLLENNGVLPLENISEIALYGAGARDTVVGGTGSGGVNTRKTVNIEKGLENAGFTITTKNWLDRQDAKIYAAKKEFLEYCEEEARRTNNAPFMIAFDNPFKEPPAEQITEDDVTCSDADTAIYVIHRISGEGSDRFDEEGDYRLFKEEIDSLIFLTTHYKKVIVVLNIGSVINISDVCDIEGIDAVLLMTQLGNIGGDALADVLTGKVNPSGKTTDTWAENYMDYPSSADFSHNGSVHEEYYTDGIYVGYRYFDSFGVKPRYPFGFGRSYTSFEIAFLSATLQNDKIVLSLRVKNTGTQYSGKEVVQIYYSAPQGKLDKPFKELIAFKKTSLIEPGQHEDITISFKAGDMASYSEEDAAWILEEGKYRIFAGNSSEDLLEIAEVFIDANVKTKQLKNLLLPDTEIKELSVKRDRERQVPKAEHITELRLNADDLKVYSAAYQKQRQANHNIFNQRLTLEDVKEGNCSLENLISQLTIEELAQICVGTLREENGSVVGNASNNVPGAAGDTTAALWETRKIPGIIMADGPAGLRLQPHFKITKDGELVQGGEVMGDSFVPFDTSVKDEDTIDYYQYCTAIPIGWALAQSWDTEMVEKIGSMVGEEMEQFHIDLWLAPALNIHRNPLCGRNFEYYSEDPFVSGVMAAAMTKGVQQHKGKGVTIKHFAANNQEDNRYFVNAHVNERAMREIYLRGFEIAVETSQPMALMTSYNLINGIHAANNKDLIQHVLRDEWKYEGMVMTDWFTSQDLPAFTGKYEATYPISASTGCVYAGNDLQMPGCQQNVDDLVEAVRTGKCIDGYTITLADLQYCSANIISTVMKTM